MRLSALGIGATLAGGGVVFFAFGLRAGLAFVIGVFAAEMVHHLRR
jgi:hypothetical protein